MILPVHRLVRAHVAGTVGRLYSLPPDDPALLEMALETPPTRALGDVAVPVAFALARRLRKAPRIIAQELVDAIGPIDGVARVEAAPSGYLNFFLDRAHWTRAWSAAGADRPRRQLDEDHRRTHRDQPEQGRAHRPPAQRRAGRRVRPASAVSGTDRRNPELHRRHRRPGRRRRHRLPGARRPGALRCPGPRRFHPVRLLLLGSLREGDRVVRAGSRPGQAAAQGSHGRAARDRARRQRHRRTGRVCRRSHRPLPSEDDERG